MYEKKYNSIDRQTIDVFKMLCAILIVSIHIRPFLSFSKTLDFFEGDIVARIAVPFFYAASAFFFFEKILFSEQKILKCKENTLRLIKYLKRIVLLYTIWSGIYLLWQIPYWNSIGWSGIRAVVDYIIAFFIRGSVYHFWYFISLIYGMIFLYKLLQIVELKKAFYIGCILYLIKRLIYGYSWIGVPGIKMVENIWNLFGGVFDGIFLALPCMLVGVLASQKHEIYLKVSKYRRGGVIISFCGLIIEVSHLYFLNVNYGKYSYVIFTFPVCIFLFSYVLEKEIHRKKKWGKKIRNYSTLIFCVHPFVIYLFKLNERFNQINSFLQYIIVLFVSLLISKFIILLSEREEFKSFRYLF